MSRKKLFWSAAALFLAAASSAFASPQRIVSLAPSLTEIICDLGLEKRIVAVTDFCDYPAEVISKPKVGGFSNPSLEAIVSVKPDIVVMTEDGNPEQLNRRLHAFGIETYIFRARRIEELPFATIELGKRLGVAKTAERKAALFAGELARFKKKGHGRIVRKVRKAIFIVQPVPLMAAGRETIMDDAFAILGIENIAAAGGRGYPKYSIEELIRLSPDALFFGKGNSMGERAQPLLKRLVFLPAVREGRVFFLDETIYRLGPRIIEALRGMSSYIESR